MELKKRKEDYRIVVSPFQEKNWIQFETPHYSSNFERISIEHGVSDFKTLTRIVNKS